MMTKNFYIAAFVVSMLAFSSCKIGKRYVRPELNLPDRIEAYTDTTDTASVENIPWESLYADEALKDLIRKALDNNKDMKIAAAKDASAQSDLQAELDAYIDDNVYLLSNQWTVSPESLEEYHQVVQDQVVMWDDALNAREVELFQELCNNVYERTIPVDAIVTQLNRLYYFRTLEDS